MATKSFSNLTRSKQFRYPETGGVNVTANVGITVGNLSTLMPEIARWEDIKGITITTAYGVTQYDYKTIVFIHSNADLIIIPSVTQEQFRVHFSLLY